jgi:glycosyltransferase involved in cell wall biosynthesis
MQDTLNNQTRKIKICLVCPKVYPLFNETIEATFGGAEVDLYYLGTELAKDANFDVSYIAADYGQSATEERENVTLIKSLNFKQNPLIGGLKIWHAMRKADADIYMMKSISPGLFLVSFFCQLYRRCFVYRTAHATHCDGSYQERNPITGRLFVRTLKKTRIIFTQNQSDADNLRQLYQIDSITIPNAHRLNAINETKRQSILWVGRSAGFKHPNRFLDLAKEFPQEKFVMICQRATRDTQYEVLKTDANSIENLTFIERVPFHEIDGYFEQAKVFVNTSDSEGFPNTFIQACKASTAILSYAVNPDEFLNQYQCGICCNGDEKYLAEQLRYMLHNNRHLHFGCHGIKYVKDTHDIATTIKQYKDIFSKELSK